MNDESKELRELIRMNLRKCQDFLDAGMPDGDHYVIRSGRVFVGFDFDSDGYPVRDSGISMHINPLDCVHFSNEREATHYAQMIPDSSVMQLAMTVAECKEACLDMFEELS